MTQSEHLTIDEQLMPTEGGDLGHIALHGVEQASTEWPVEQREATLAAMEERIDVLSKEVPELATERDRVVRGATELADTFEVNAAFFAEPKQSMIFFSLGYRNDRTNEAARGHDADRLAVSDSRDFIANATFLLTRKHANAYPELRQQHEHQLHDGATDVDKALARAIHKYEQPAVTRELNDYIEAHDIYGPTKERLGIPADDTDVPHMHALSIGRSAGVYFDTEQNGLTWSEVNAWSKGLEQRAEAFAVEVPGGELASRAAGFAVELDGEHHVCLPQASAEMVIDDQHDIASSDFFDLDKARKRIIGTLRHEYTHTKDAVNVGDAFGKSLEERRAEWFSGDNGEYYEVKRFFRHLHILFGKDLGALYDEGIVARKEGSDTTIYEQLANAYGLDMVAEIAAAQPDAYVQFSKSQITHDMLRSLGGYDAIISRLSQNPRWDREDALRRFTKGINGLRFENGKEGQDEDYEQFLGSYFTPVLNAFNLRLADLAYQRPQPEATDKK